MNNGPNSSQMKEYQGDFNTLERGSTLLMRSEPIQDTSFQPQKFDKGVLESMLGTRLS